MTVWSHERRKGDAGPAVQLKFERSNAMKSSSRDKVEGKFHEVKGKVKEIAGKVSDDRELEAEGFGEKVAGQVQEKRGQIKEVFRR